MGNILLLDLVGVVDDKLATTINFRKIVGRFLIVSKPFQYFILLFVYFEVFGNFDQDLMLAFVEVYGRVKLAVRSL